jgi:zinc/manganese transport system substrate-binding protein
MRPLFVCTALALTLLVAACGSDDGAAGGGLRVLATTTQVADLARNVAGDRASVTGILTPNSDPHDYEPRPADAKAVADADLVLRSGAAVDDWLGDLLKSAGSDARSVTLIDDVRTRSGEGGEVDPHWWQDPRNARTAVLAIRDALAKADPDGTATYDADAEAYLGRLDALDTAIARCMDSIPADRRKLVTNHDALGYFADRYGIDVVGAVIPSLSSQAQPSAKDVDELVDQIKREQVEAIFPEAALSKKLEQAISRESGAEVGGQLWADTLGPPGSSGATYVDAIEANATALAEGMSGGSVSCDFSR